MVSWMGTECAHRKCLRWPSCQGAAWQHTLPAPVDEDTQWQSCLGAAWQHNPTAPVKEQLRTATPVWAGLREARMKGASSGQVIKGSVPMLHEGKQVGAARIITINLACFSTRVRVPNTGRGRIVDYLGAPIPSALKSRHPLTCGAPASTEHQQQT
eukprot:1158046-Pelagomonas_calceolata.AAC.9